MNHTTRKRVLSREASQLSGHTQRNSLAPFPILAPAMNTPEQTNATCTRCQYNVHTATTLCVSASVDSFPCTLYRGYGMWIQAHINRYANPTDCIIQ